MISMFFLGKWLCIKRQNTGHWKLEDVFTSRSSCWPGCPQLAALWGETIASNEPKSGCKSERCVTGVVCVSLCKSFMWATWAALPSSGREESSSCWWLSWRTGKRSLTPWPPPITSKSKPGNRTGGGCSWWSRGADIWMVRMQTPAMRVYKCVRWCSKQTLLFAQVNSRNATRWSEFWLNVRGWWSPGRRRSRRSST